MATGLVNRENQGARSRSYPLVTTSWDCWQFRQFSLMRTRSKFMPFFGDAFLSLISSPHRLPIQGCLPDWEPPYPRAAGAIGYRVGSEPVGLSFVSTPKACDAALERWARASESSVHPVTAGAAATPTYFFTRCSTKWPSKGKRRLVRCHGNARLLIGVRRHGNSCILRRPRRETALRRGGATWRWQR